MLSHSREKVDFDGNTIFSIGDHLGFSTRLNFITLKPCSLITLHANFGHLGCSDFREFSILKHLKARVNANFARVDVNFQTVIVT